MTLEPESITLSMSTEKEQNVSTQKSSRSGWMEEANCQWPGKPLWKSYMTLNSPSLLVISAPASVLLNHKLYPSFNFVFCLYSLFTLPTHVSVALSIHFCLQEFVILYLINIWCLSVLFSLCCLALTSPQLLRIAILFYVPFVALAHTFISSTSFHLGFSPM